jgi:hypothetical protein
MREDLLAAPGFRSISPDIKRYVCTYGESRCFELACQARRTIIRMHSYLAEIVFKARFHERSRRAIQWGALSTQVADSFANFGAHLNATHRKRA